MPHFAFYSCYEGRGAAGSMPFFHLTQGLNIDIVSTVSIKEKVKITENLVNKVFEEILHRGRYAKRMWAQRRVLFFRIINT